MLISLGLTDLILNRCNCSLILVMMPRHEPQPTAQRLQQAARSRLSLSSLHTPQGAQAHVYG